MMILKKKNKNILSKKLIYYSNKTFYLLLIKTRIDK